ncbi:hypothetical protein QBC39DRAFT_333901 [Podospora conica]|nr:hypothetical protein QBC39DRAFT_333901 [Schizothecium conicum]
MRGIFNRYRNEIFPDSAKIIADRKYNISKEALKGYSVSPPNIARLRLEGLEKKDNLEDYLLDRGNTSEAKYPLHTSSKVLISILPVLALSTSSKVLISILPGSNKYPTGTSFKLLISILLILALRKPAEKSRLYVNIRDIYVPDKLRNRSKVIKVFNDFYSTLTKSILKLEYLRVYDIPFYYERDEEK